MNRIILIGNLTRDPEAGATASGKMFTRFTVAVRRRFQRDETDFFNVSVWGALAENCGRYLRKGRKVCVTGELNMQTKTDYNGDKRVYSAVTADEVEFLSPATESETSGKAEAGYDGRGNRLEEETDTDLPF